MRSSSRMTAPMHGDSVKPPRNPMTQMVPGYADGGLIGGAVKSIKDRQNALEAIDRPAPEPQAAPTPAVPSGGSEAANYAAQAAKIEADQAAEAKARIAAANKPKSIMSRLGFAQGGKIDGPGTPTSDSIPAVVAETGQDILVADEERILSADQDAFLEKLAKDLGFENLEAMLEAGTGKPVGPTMKAGMPAAAGGAEEDELKNAMHAVMQPQAPAAPTPAETMQGVKNRSIERSVSDVTPRPAPAQAPAVAQPAPAAVDPASKVSPAAALPGNIMDSAVDTVTGAGKMVLGAVAAPFAAAGDAGANLLASSMGRARPDPHSNLGAVAEFTSDGARAAAKPFKDTANIVGNVAQNSAEAAGWTKIPDPVQATAPKAPTATPATSAQKPVSATSAPVAQGAQERTFQAPTAAAPAAAPVRQTSFTESNTAESPVNPLNRIDMVGNNESLARTNAIRQSMIDGDGTGPKVTMLEDSGRVESQALMDKWGRESAVKDAMSMAAANPKAAQAIASIMGANSAGDASRNRDSVELQTRGDANQTARRGQDTRLQEQAMHSATVTRGQDVTAQTEANKLAGNPMDNLLKQSTANINQNAVKKAEQQDRMVAQIGAEQDADKRRALMDALLASQGKNPSEHRYVKVDGGEEIGPDGYTKIRRPSGVYDTASGRFLPMDGPVAKAPVAPKVGEVRSGYRFKGGDPSSKASWEKA